MPPPPKFATAPASTQPDVGWCAAIYGPPGSGKTPIACDIIYSDFGSPAALLDIEGGSRSVAHLPSDKLHVMYPTEGNGTRRPWKWEDIRDIVKWIRDEPESVLGYKTFIFDNMSEVQNIAIQWAKGDSPEVQIQHHGKATAELLQMVRTLRDASQTKKLNILFIVWEAPETDAITGVVKRDVGFTPSFARQFPGLIDMVGYLSVESPGKRKLSFEPSARTAARFRRSQVDRAKDITSEIKFGLGDYPVADLCNTLRGNAAWPAKYRLINTPATAPRN